MSQLALDFASEPIARTACVRCGFLAWGHHPPVCRTCATEEARARFPEAKYALMSQASGLALVAVRNLWLADALSELLLPGVPNWDAGVCL